MEHYPGYFAKIVALALFWAISGYIIGVAIEAYGFNAYPFGLVIASTNAIIGMLWLKGLIQDPLGDRMFFEGPAPDEDGDLRVGCLWVMPVVLIFIGLLLWFWAIILHILINK